MIAGRPKIAVIAHIFYEEMWSDLVRCLKRIPCEFDLFVTVPESKFGNINALVKTHYPRSRILPCRNKGRDIGPFFVGLFAAENANDYLAICKVHTKKGITEAATWRFLLLDGVLGSIALVDKIIGAFAAEPRLALVGAQDLYFSGPKFLEQNKANFDRMASALIADVWRPQKWGFFAGTMFWFRPAVFASMARYVAEWVDFEEEQMLNDGQIAHSLERMFGYLPAALCLKIGLVQRMEGNDHVLIIDDAPSSYSTEPPVKLLARKAKELGLGA